MNSRKWRTQKSLKKHVFFFLIPCVELERKNFPKIDFPQAFAYVALKKGHSIRKARGKTQGISIPPYY